MRTGCSLRVSLGALTLRESCAWASNCQAAHVGDSDHIVGASLHSVVPTRCGMDHAQNRGPKNAVHFLPHSLFPCRSVPAQYIVAGPSTGFCAGGNGGSGGGNGNLPRWDFRWKPGTSGRSWVEINGPFESGFFSTVSTYRFTLKMPL